MRKSITRRRVITAAGAGLTVSIAGCTSSGDTDNSLSEGSGDANDSPEPENVAIDSIKIGTYELTVTLTGNAEVDTLRLINPDGSERSSSSVGTGVTKATFSLLHESSGYSEAMSGYEAGEYTLLALYEDTVVQEKTLNITPDLRITGFASTVRGGPLLRVQNTGSGPAWIQEGKANDANTEEEPEMDGVNRFIDGELEYVGVDSVVPVDEERVIGLQGENLQSDGQQCTGEYDVEVVLKESAIGEVSSSFSITFTGESESFIDGAACGTSGSELPVTLE